MRSASCVTRDDNPWLCSWGACPGDRPGETDAGVTVRWLTTLRRSAHLEANGDKTWVEVPPKVWQPLLDVAEAAEEFYEQYRHGGYKDAETAAAAYFRAKVALKRAVADTTQAET